MSKDAVNRLARNQILAPVLKTATWQSGAIDVLGYDALAILLSVGAHGDTWDGTNFWALTLQKSVDSAFTSPVAVGAEEMHGVSGRLASSTWCTLNADAEDTELYQVGVDIDADYRYYRVVCTENGTLNTGTIFGVIAELGGGVQPASTNLTTPA